MQHKFIKLVVAVAMITAALAATACSSAEEPAATPDAALQAQSVPVDSAPAATATPLLQAIATATETTLKTEIVEEPVSPVAPPAAAAQTPDENAMQLPDNLPPGSEPAVKAAIADLAQQQGIDPLEITVVAVEPTDWSDASLGCPQEGFMYAQVITPGFLVTLQTQGNTYEYHTNQNDHVVLCQP